MIELIVYALALLIFQVMAHYPLNLQHIQFFLSNRHESIEFNEITLRIQRAASNLKETLPVFLVLMILGIVQDVDLTSLGSYWLILRVLFFGLYAAGIEKIRSVVWILALVDLIAMALSILASA
tara:strand:- start:405 stop:776 length:372 start_codon:yes stop_codon:yes gene_type:complete